MQIRVVTILGTRPEIIRLSRVMAALDATCRHTLIHTGQNMAAGLHRVFFDQMRLRPPDIQLEVATAPFHSMAADLFAGIGPCLADIRPHAVLILGDTNSALAALVARKQGIPIYHMEAGHRCFDRESPEEVNRRVIDHLSDFNLPYTEAARRNLLAEGLSPQRIYVTGSPLKEVAAHYAADIGGSDVLARLALAPGGYFAASFHRQENVDDPARLVGLLQAVERVARQHGRPVLLSTHPRTASRIAAAGYQPPAEIRLVEPMGYFDWCHLQAHAACVISDSGTVSEEAALFGFPAVIARRSMERPESMDSGHVVMGGVETAGVVEAAGVAMAFAPSAKPLPADYDADNVAERVVKLILGTCGPGQRWR